jgi:hypothetical protein
VQILSSPAANNSQVQIQQNITGLQAIRLRLRACVLAIFPDIFEIVGPTNHWPPHWHFDCVSNGLIVTSLAPNLGHRIQFQWYIRELNDHDDNNDNVTRLQVISVVYNGPFELQVRPQDVV